MSKQCIKCGNIVSHYKELCNNCYAHQYYLDNKEKCKTRNKLWKEKNPEKARAIYTKGNRKRGMLSIDENYKCPHFLGIHVAERVLSKVFKDVVKQPFGNPGFDFICNHGKKIDVKSACLFQGKWGKPIWHFMIRRNKIADYFLCLAFDNRDDLNPLHMWLLPANVFNHMYGTSISTSTVDKWNQYNIPVDKVITCCNVLKGNK